MSHEVEFKAPKAGLNEAVKVTVNDWPEGKDEEYIQSAIKLWGAGIVADNIDSVAEQKAQNSMRAAANPGAKGEAGKSVEDIRKEFASWKLGAVRPRGTRTVSSEAYMSSLEAKSPQEILAEIEKMKALLAAKKAQAKG